MNHHSAPIQILVTCEHGGNRIPAAYRELFAGHESLLKSHRGYDAGALSTARELARALNCRLIASTISRLLVDLNRSARHPTLFSEIVKSTPPAVRSAILSRHYTPYRHRVIQHIASAVGSGEHVVHISSHSFTPCLSGQIRNADIGFLYDPGRESDVTLCTQWMSALKRLAPTLRLRRNYPYTGNSDGFCAWLRRRYTNTEYTGVELEVNQRHALAGGVAGRRLRSAIAASLIETMTTCQTPAST